MKSIAAAFVCTSLSNATVSGCDLAARGDRFSIDFAPASAARLSLLSLLLAIGCRA
jgi:hypothetical protein